MYPCHREQRGEVHPVVHPKSSGASLQPTTALLDFAEEPSIISRLVSNLDPIDLSVGDLHDRIRQVPSR
jgi:hypothetical protein